MAEASRWRCVQPSVIGAYSVGLPVGQMIKRPDLRLLDAMNSIEILDPRMDTGIKPASKRDFIFDPQMSMEPEELCWVMDEMLAMEVYHFTLYASGTNSN